MNIYFSKYKQNEDHPELAIPLQYKLFTYIIFFDIMILNMELLKLHLFIILTDKLLEYF